MTGASVESADGAEEHWFVRGTKPASAPTRVFCFHCAGSSARQFLHWDAVAPAHVELIGVQLPGREKRFRETPLHDFPELIDALIPQLVPLLDRPYALFGHSLGALVAIEAARALRRMRARDPEHLFVAARSAPQLPHAFPAVDEFATPRFLHVLGLYGGISQDNLRDSAFMNDFLPTIRADFKLVRLYRYEHDAPLSCPITAFGGDDDATCSESELQAWQEQTVSSFECRILPGGHFFVRPHANAIVEHIVRMLERDGRDERAGQ